MGSPRSGCAPADFHNYRDTTQDPLEIQVPDSPWIQVFQEVWKRRQ